MKLKATLLSGLLVLAGISARAQVGVGTNTPKSSLQVEGKPTQTSTADGIQGPTLSLAQLDAKIAAYGTDQDGAIVYIDDISPPSTKPETSSITATGYYYYDAANDKWRSMGEERNTYAVGDVAQGGIVFWVSPSGRSGLVLEDSYMENKTWQNATNHVDNHQHAGFTDWKLPSIDQLSILFQNKYVIDETTGYFIAWGIGSKIFWSSTADSGDAKALNFNTGTIIPTHAKSNTAQVIAIRRF